MLRGIAKRVGRKGIVHGIDPVHSSEMESLAKSHDAAWAKIRYQKASIENLPFETGSIDGIWIHAVLAYVPDKLTALNECFRVLKPDGWIAIGEDQTSSNILFGKGTSLNSVQS